MRRLIATVDDFGLAVPVNEAVEIAHREGIATAASLMVSAPAADDAVKRALCLPSLRVGLHVVVVEGRPCLPPDSVPDLVDAAGEFRCDLVRAGFRFFFRPAVRRQLEAEIRAQFEAFRATGLTLDHVNAHNHMHLHPSVLGLVLEVGRDFGLRALRVPWEPAGPSARAAGRGRFSRIARAAGFALVAAPLRARLRREGLLANDRLFGLYDSGRMDEALVLALLAQLPDGLTEIYFHAATRTCPELDRHMRDYAHERELAALTSPRVRAALDRFGIERVAFSDL